MSKLEVKRQGHKLFTEAVNAHDRILKTIDSNHQTRLEQRGIKETNAERRDRNVYRLSRPLNAFGSDVQQHELLQHQAVHIDPYSWDFSRGEKDKRGKEKLKITVTKKAGWDESKSWKSWHEYEKAGTTNATDAEIYNSTRVYKKMSDKTYSILNSNCQHAAEDVAYQLTSGKSRLSPAPSRRIPAILAKKVMEEGVPRTALKLSKTAKHYSKHYSTETAARGHGRKKLVHDKDDSDDGESDRDETDNAVDYEEMLKTLGALSFAAGLS